MKRHGEHFHIHFVWQVSEWLFCFVRENFSPTFRNRCNIQVAKRVLECRRLCHYLALFFCISKHFKEQISNGCESVFPSKLWWCVVGAICANFSVFLLLLLPCHRNNINMCRVQFAVYILAEKFQLNRRRR